MMKNIGYVNLKSFLAGESISCPASVTGSTSLRLLVIATHSGRTVLFEVEKDKKTLFQTSNALDAAAVYNAELENLSGVEPPKTKFKKGDLVMFARSIQNCETGMRIQAVDQSTNPPTYLLDYKWWTEGCFVPYEEWRKKYRP